jgi:hypothetical protein
VQDSGGPDVRDLKSRLQGPEKLRARQEYPGDVARKVDKFETV